MAKYSKNVLVFCIGMLLVSLWCMKVNGHEHGHAHAHGKGSHGHQDIPVGCNSKNSDAGEQCTDEDDHLGLYADIDDTFKKIVGRKGEKHEIPFSADDDSPNVAHNNVDVLGH
ncbi:unnamed protein product [Vicia faba]|uniref:Uncharacterized protein n=1 Tax=Vicia faba TaxID=3906 RepID=A0AAV0YP81_VICFA|nr:unnamed protein product [Vicia faba]